MANDLRNELQRTLGDAYTLEQELGGGGMSRVFVAKETALGRHVVVKVLPAEMTGQLSIDRFKREIAVAAQLQHPHIVPLLTAGDAGGLPYFTMPYVRGESLRVRLSKHGELPISEAVRILREVASALAFAHEAGVVHRDIKPDNVLIAGDAAMVTDFGVAKALSASTTGGGSGLTSLGVALGTPAYMAPEQATADPMVDHRADVYSWGVLAYELLTGATPFHGRPPQAMLAAHVNEEPEAIARRRSNVPPALAQLVMRSLAKRAADRPQRAQELVHALDAIVTPSGGMQPTGVLPATAASPAAKRRRWALLGAAAVAVGVLVYVALQRAGPSAAILHAIAVLPFENTSGDTAYDYFANGIGDELRSQLTQLTKASGIAVQGRTSSLAFRGARVNLHDVGSKLRVDAVVLGTLGRSGTRLHLTAELVNVADGAARWSETYDRDVKELSTVQGSITQAIAGALKLALASAPSRARSAENPEAHDLYLRGRFASFKSSEADYRQALTFFSQALEKDPSMAATYAGIAFTWAFLADAYVSPAEAYPKAKSAALKAIALDSASAEGHFALSFSAAFLDWDVAAAERALQHSLSLNPQLAEAHSQYGGVLCFDGRSAEGIAELDRAVALDPLSPIPSLLREWCLYHAGRYREAIAQRRRTLEIDPRFFYLMSGDVAGYRELGLLDSALAAGERDRKLAGGVPSYNLAIAYARAGRKEEARDAIAALEAEYRRAYYPPDLIAVAYANLGELDRAFEWLEKVFETRSSFFQWFSRGPEWEALRADPRWAAFRKRAEAARRLSP